MHGVRRRVVVVLFVGGLGTLMLGAAIPILLSVRTFGVRPPPLPSASATPTAQVQVEVLADVPPAGDTQAGSLADPTTEQAAPEPAIMLDEQFDHRHADWPVRTDGTVWLGASYHLSVKSVSHFVAVRAPIVTASRSIVMTGVFQKVGGPDGGGYGLIVRDRSAAPLDGDRQDGQYYVFEAGDRGFIGVWRRDDLTWVDLVPWSFSGAVRTGRSSNELTVRASGDHFEFEVNGVLVAEVADDVLDDGHVGLFVGGDGNQVVADRFIVRGGN